MPSKFLLDYGMKIVSGTLTTVLAAGLLGSVAYVRALAASVDALETVRATLELKADFLDRRLTRIENLIDNSGT